MSEPIKNEHMSKPHFKSDNLPSLQRLIVLNFAESEPQTVNETVKAISKSYKATWNAFNSLEKKSLIEKIDVKHYRGREYPRFWLTAEGIVMALMEGANFDRLLEQAKILYPDAKTLHCFLEIMPYTKPELLKLGYSIIKGKKEVGMSELATLTFSKSANQMSAEDGKKFVATLEKYPEEYKEFKTKIQSAIDQLSQLITEKKP
ncbi:MAG: hypothetical protein QCH99_09665 [Candidatus Bathyarchaeota archaeon]|nr:hypothetical protein [Candidatus Bathyarchaeum tardum]